MFNKELRLPFSNRSKPFLNTYYLQTALVKVTSRFKQLNALTTCCCVYEDYMSVTKMCFQQHDCTPNILRHDGSAALRFKFFYFNCICFEVTRDMRVQIYIPSFSLYLK